MSWNVSVVLVTRDRPAMAAQAIASILESGTGDFELVVVDQGDTPVETPASPRVRLVRSAPGLSIGRNVGVSHCRHEYVGFTDDDCLVSRDWVDQIARVLHEEDIGMVFGNVRPAQQMEGDVIPAHINKRAQVAATVWQRNRIEGMGACMALRRSVWDTIGGFDECLGAGGGMQSGEETDFAIRVLQAGFRVGVDPRFEVVHLGARRLGEVARLTASYWRGTGATFAKFLRSCPAAALYSLAGLGLRWLCGGASQVAQSTGAGRWAMLKPFMGGLRWGLRAPMKGGCFLVEQGKASASNDSAGEGR